MTNGFSRSQHRLLGTTGLSISPLSLGTVKIGRNSGVKYPSGFQLPSDEEVVSLLAFAANLGINLIDTAPAYGESEARLGELLAASRQDWVICTKAGEFYEDGSSRYDYSERAVIESIEASLKRLRTDYLDIVLVHSDGDDINIVNNADVLGVLHDYKSQGVIGAVGFSPKTPEGAYAALPMSDVMMVTLNPEDRSHETFIADAARADCGVLLKKIFASGHYSDPGACIEYVLGVSGVGSAVVGTINEGHLAANVEAALQTLAD